MTDRHATAPGSARDAIRAAALRVIGTHGIAGLTNRRVAAEAGVSLGSLTYHYASQRDLLRESVQSFVQAETARIRSIAHSLAGDAPTVAQAAAAAEQVLAQMTPGEEELGVYEVYVHAARDPELYPVLRECFAAYDEVAASALRTLGVSAAADVAPHVVALIAGAQLRRLATGTSGTGIAQALLVLAGGRGE
jgi:DNA-binding transcriptional regulator YbjK